MRALPSDAVMDRKMFKVERNTAISVGIDCVFVSFSSIVFSVTVHLSYSVAVPYCKCVDAQRTFIMCFKLAGETISYTNNLIKWF